VYTYKMHSLCRQIAPASVRRVRRMARADRYGSVLTYFP